MKTINNKIIVSYGENLKNNLTHRVSFKNLINDMKNGKHKLIIGEIRTEKNKHLRRIDKLNNLPYFSFARYKDNLRSNANFIYARFMVFDIDNISEQKIIKIKTYYKKSKKAFCCFLSPSGNGLKIIYKLSTQIKDVNEYRNIYQSQASKIEGLFKLPLDKTSDPARTCFISYDPEIIYYPECKPIDVDKLKKEVQIIKKKITYADIDLSLLEEITDFLTGKVDYDEWIKCGFALASLGEAGRKHFVRFSVNNPQYNDKVEDMNKKFDDLLLKFESNKITIKSLFYLAQKKGYEFKSYRITEFWGYPNNKLDIRLETLLEFLTERGYGKAFHSDKYHLVHRDNNILQIVNSNQIKDYVLGYLDANKHNNVREFMLRKSKYYFDDKLFESLKTIELSFLKDTKDLSFFYFNNCYIEISKDEINVKDYNGLKNTVIWDKHILNRDFTRVTYKSDFEVFIANICNNDKSRIYALESSIGYLLHTYKNPSFARAIIFCDEKISNNAYGRSGKSLVGKAISFMRKTTNIDGRLFRFNANFAYQEVGINTQIIHFNDVEKQFPFDKLFSSITDGLHIEKKNKDAFTIPFESSPKFLITTNYVIQGEDDSSIDRKFEIEFSDYYNKNKKPIHVFGKLFFIDWIEDEWNAFHLYMIHCLQLFLKHGLITYKHVNLKKKKLIDATDVNFPDFIKAFKKNKELNVKTLFSNYTRKYTDSIDYLKQNTFTKWLNKYAEIYGYKINVRNSSGKKFIRFVRNAVK